MSMSLPREAAETRQFELYYLCSRLAAAVYAYHGDESRSEDIRNFWWHSNLNKELVSTGQQSFLR